MTTKKFIIKTCAQLGSQFRKEAGNGQRETAEKLLRIRMFIQNIMNISDDDVKAYIHNKTQTK
jgi:hypothetical protein